jgi:hypothetical protein
VPDRPLTNSEREKYAAGLSLHAAVDANYVPLRNIRNDYLIDRALQKTTSFTGINGVNTQDMALQEGMGAITDRSREMLGTSDRAIVVMRRMLLDATRAVERGETPRGTDPEAYRDVRPHDGLVPAGTDWRDAFTGAAVSRW